MEGRTFYHDCGPAPSHFPSSSGEMKKGDKWNAVLLCAAILGAAVLAFCAGAFMRAARATYLGLMYVGLV